MLNKKGGFFLEKKVMSLLILSTLFFGIQAKATEETIDSSQAMIESSSILESSSETTTTESETQETSTTTSETSSSDVTESSDSSEEIEDKVEEQDYYASVIKSDSILWEKIDLVEKGTTSDLVNQTFFVKEKVTKQDGRIFLLLVNQSEEVVGYVESEAVERANGPEGIWSSNSEFIVLKDKTVKLYSNFDWEPRVVSADTYEQTLHAKGKYHHFNGHIYYSLYNNQGNWQGYVLADDVVVATGRQGTWRQMDQYVIVSKKNYPTYQNFNWTVKNNTSNLMNKTYRAQGYYRHFNGSIYYSLYDNQGRWHGYVNKNAVTDAAGPQGNFIKANKYVTMTNKNYPTYSNFNWAVRHQGGALHQQTFRVKGYYNHVNGSVYYSLYDNNDKWYGYVNKNSVSEGSGKQGAYIATNDYVTVTRTNYDLWQNFSWNKKGSSSQIYQKTYQVRGKYNHFNGSTYYSLFDNNGTWKGYINKNGVTLAPGRQGIWLSKNEKGTVAKRGYDVWQNFNWDKKNNTNNMYGQQYQVKGYYNHYNGSTYYSLYNNNGTWQGYVNANAISFTRSISMFLETTEERVVTHLRQNESNSFYLGTPYRSVMGSPDPNYVMSPRGRPNGYGAGMNCTGFVAYAYREGGANLNKITQVSNQWGGVGNAYNWFNALTRNTDYSTFGSINSLLASGKAKKGDILYFVPNYALPNPDPHIGIFWGDSGKQDRFFHCTWPSVKISNIYSGTPYSQVYLFPL